LNDDLTEAEISVYLTGQNLEDKGYSWTLTSPAGNVVATDKGTIHSEKFFCLSLEKPELWWPHDHGEQPLYVSEIRILDQQGNELDSKRQKVGFRRARLVMNEGLWQEDIPFPKTRNKPPVTMEINGRRIFSKGTNWVNPEIFPGIITAESYNELLDLA
jgi:beta-mannosidase